MNHDEHPTNSALAQSLQDSLSRLTVATRPPLAEITSRGRARQRRRRAGLAGFASLTGAAAGTALALSLTGALGTAPAQTSTSTSSGASSNPSTVRTAAFILTSNANGTDSLTLTMGQVLDPGNSRGHSRNTASGPWSRLAPTARQAPRHPTRRHRSADRHQARRRAHETYRPQHRDRDQPRGAPRRDRVVLRLLSPHPLMFSTSSTSSLTAAAASCSDPLPGKAGVRQHWVLALAPAAIS